MKTSLFITTVHLNTGGIETSLINLLNSLDSSKYDIDLVMYYPQGNLMEYIPSWVNVIPLYNLTKKPKLFSKILTSRNILFRIIKNITFNKYTAKFYTPKKKYDASISYAGYHEFCNALAGHVKADKKLIWCHGDFLTQVELDKAFKNKFKKIHRQYKLFDNIVCVSKVASQNMIKLCPKHKYKITYLYNVVKKRDLSHFTDNITVDKNDNDFFVLTISRLNKFKGIDRLLKVAELTKNINSNIKFVIAGDGPLKSEYEETISKRNLDNVILLGDVFNIKNLFDFSNLYLSCSDCESFGISIMESLIYGCPVLATATAGAKDIYNYIAPKGSVYLAHTFNPEELAKVIIDIYNKQEFNKFNEFDLDLEKFNQNIITRFENILK